MDPRGLRLIVFDRTCRSARLPLSRAWRAGSWLYRGLGRVDLVLGAASWEEALRWLAEARPTTAPIREVQIWSHGRWGRALLESDALDEEALLPGHRLHAGLQAVRERLRPSSLWWFRTCETFGAVAGQRFARALVEFFGCRVAGHTHVIGFWQSGLHSLGPGEEPGWSTSEGVVEGSAEEPQRAARSGPAAPNTITCLHGGVPAGF